MITDVRAGRPARLSLAVLTLCVLAVLPAPAAAAPVWLATAEVAPPTIGLGATAIDADGTVVAVWNANVPSGSVLRVAQRPPGGAWSAPVDLTPTITDHYVGEPKIGIDDAGTATALWEYLDQDGIGDNTTVLQSARRPRGGPWGTIETVSAPAVSPEDIGRTDLAVAPGGALTAVWQFTDYGSGYRVVSARRSVQGAWEAPTELTTAPVASGEALPRVAVDDSGRAAAVWTQSPTVVLAASRDAAGAWDAPVTVSGAPGNVADPSVAMDASGTATAVWRRFSGGFRVETASRAAGEAWGTPEFLSSAAASTNEPQIAVDPDGQALAAWRQTDGANVLIRAKRRPAGGAWQATADDLSVTGQNGLYPAAILDRAGNATVAWNRSNGTEPVVQAAHASPSGAWSAPVDVATGGTDVDWFRLSANPSGDLALSWRRDNSLVAAVGVVPPTCTSTTAAAQAAAAVTVDLPCSGTVDTRAIGAAPALGALGPIDQALGRVTFTAGPGPGGTDAFTFTGTNAAGTSAPATVNLTITPQPPAPAGPAPGVPAPPAPTPKPAAVAFNALATLPATKKCVSRRVFRIRLRVPKGVGVTSAEVRVNGKRVRTVKRSRFTAPVDLRNLPKGRVKVNIRVKLADGRTITGTRTYRTCAAKKR